MRLTEERVRELLAGIAATPGSWASRLGPHGIVMVLDGVAITNGYAGHEIGYASLDRSDCDAIGAMFAAAPDLAADLIDAHAALATERERAEAAEKALVTARADALREAAALCVRESNVYTTTLARAITAKLADQIAALARCP